MKKKLLLLFMCLTLISYAQTTSIPDTNFEQALIDLGHDDVLDGSVITANISGVENLTLDDKQIENLTGIEGFKALKIFSMVRNYQIRTLDLSMNTELTNLYCYASNKLENIDLSKNTKLVFLNLGAIGLTSIDVSKNTALKGLYLHSNKLKTIDISNNTELIGLTLDNNKLEELDLTNQTKLTGSLDLEYNLLKSIDLSNNLEIQALKINNNQIKVLDVSAHSKLIRLHASNNPQLESLNIKNGANGFISNLNFSVRNTPRLSCIQVDDASWSNTNWTQKDVTVTYKENCNPIIWSGNISSDWSLAANWEGGAIPNTTDEVLIPSTATNFPTINSSTTVKSIVMESGATLVANESVDAIAIYKRNLATTNWYLMSSPLEFESIRDLIKNNQFANGTKNNNIGLAFYDNRNSPNNRWEYQKTTSFGSIGLGKGFAVKLANSSGFFSKGKVNSKKTDVNLSKAATSYNLIGNPYLALVKSSDFLQRNTNSLESETIWVWNQATNSYDTKVTADNYKIGTGQAFFVKSKSNTETVSFLLADQTHGADTFQRGGNDRPELKLNVSNGKINKYAKIYFVESATKGFDNGYDGELFSSGKNKFEIYSELLEGNKNKKYQIQSISAKEKHSIIPIGVSAKAGEKINFSVEKKNFPDDIKIYIEDKEKQLFVQLSIATENYSVDLSKKINGTGRFYLHTSAKDINENDFIKNSQLKIKHLGANVIHVEGIENEATINIYTIQGKEVVSKQLKQNNNQVQLPKLASGVYLVKVQTEEEQKTKKIILK
ncbi:T9SS type A sorting domain-containing protein [Tenacibaculum aiptasiae]|uniref:T9SS type A sorting domain-containing protein n=1 Tax=Tenacibaculum aiptasiae TaxID=426481 RepID=UPI003B5CDF28